MNQFCQSCGAPLAMPEMQGPAENYCKYCTDEQGQLKARDEVQGGIAEWLKTWQAGLTPEKARSRAAHYMKAMPAWAE
jgi:hypothetical protein